VVQKKQVYGRSIFNKDFQHIIDYFCALFHEIEKEDKSIKE